MQHGAMQHGAMASHTIQSQTIQILKESFRQPVPGAARGHEFFTLADKVPQFRLRDLRQNYGSRHVFAQTIMWHGEGNDLGHGGMIQKNFVSFARADFFARQD